MGRTNHTIEINMADYKPKNISDALNIAKKIANKRYTGIVQAVESDSSGNFYTQNGKIYFRSVPFSMGDKEKINNVIDKVSEIDSGLFSNVTFNFGNFFVKYESDNLVKVEPTYSKYDNVKFNESYRKVIKRDGLSEKLKKEAEKRGLKTNIRKETYGEKEIHYGGLDGFIRKIKGNPLTEKIPQYVEMLCIVPRKISECDKVRFIQREISENNPKSIELSHNPYGFQLGENDTKLSLPQYALDNKGVVELLDMLFKEKIASALFSKWELELEIDAKIPDIKTDETDTRKVEKTSVPVELHPKAKSQDEIIVEALINKGYDTEKGNKGIAEYCVLVK